MSQDQGPTVAHGPRVVAGRYAILNELGRGGMGVVWLAEDRMIGRHVAIKELHLPDGVPGNERAVFEERVLREARTAGRLNDPAVVTVFDVVQEAGATYIVMELIQAPTLSDIVRERGPLPAAQVAKLAEQLLSALEAAHQAGIVHRDVKPSNIMLAANGRAKLTDFGIAQSLDDPRLTSSGMLIGSPTYMAPERIRGEEAGASSDLWALGAVLFYAIEGYNPFERPTTAATMHAILAEVPHLTRAQGALASVISGLMIGTPAARLTSAQVHGLLTYVPTGPATGPTAVTAGAVHYPTPNSTAPAPLPPGRPKSKVLAIAAVLVLLLGAVGGYFLNSALNAPAEQEQPRQIAKYTYGGDAGDLPEFSISDGYCATSVLQKGTAFSSNDDCAEVFQVQVFGTLEPSSSSAPWGYRKSELDALGESYCGWLFSTERVKEDNKKDLTYAVILPSQDSWDAKDSSSGRDHTMHCVLLRANGAKITGSQVESPN
ncbi:serine/threonine protein kinase [Actinokineospora baliensis]|uniref:serine/threonine-protein kinase n=1 Tax=Actinokineospora baliensis TaxID=547056 RepID=UPI0027DE8003|nr:protein kinase [Actinokineospora baliensis]MBM7775844.1 serine/threonine protein kinase [Actinokineospora baliensis]